MTLREKIDYLKKVITVEPILFIFLIVRNNHSAIESDMLSFFEFDPSLWTDHPLFYIIVFELILPASLLLFLGSYSDQHRPRKPFLLLPLFGEMISFIGTFLCYANLKHCSKHLFLLLKTIPICFGGMYLVLAMSIAYVVDITKEQSQTFRIGVVRLIVLVVLFALADVNMFRFSGELEATVNICLLLVAIFYGIFWLPGSVTWPKMRTILDMFHPRHVQKTVNTLCVKRPFGGRSVIFVLLGTLVLRTFMSFNNDILLDEVGPIKTGFWRYFTLVLAVLCVAAAIVFLKCLRVSDVAVILGSLVCLLCSNIIFGLAGQNITLVTIWQGFYHPSDFLFSTACVAMLVKMVPKEDCGKILSLYTVCYALVVPFTVVVHLYFEEELIYYSHVCFYLTAMLCAVLVPVFGWMYVQNRRHQRRGEAQTFVNNDDEEGDAEFNVHFTVDV